MSEDKTKNLELVSFEQAKKLKELGFVWGCLYHYSFEDEDSGIIFNTPILKINRDAEYMDYELGDDEYYAPEIALALKWFRGKYVFDLWAQNFHFYDGNRAGENAVIKGSIGFNDKFFNFSEFNKLKEFGNAYEAAESALLDKLLEICLEEK